MLQERSKELQGKGGGTKFTTRLENFSEEHETSLWCILHLSARWQDPVVCYWQRKSLQRTDKEWAERENLLTGLFPTILTGTFSFSTFSVWGLSNPEQQGRAIQALWLNFCCILPVSWPLLLTASCPVSYAAWKRKSWAETMVPGGKRLNQSTDRSQ